MARNPLLQAIDAHQSGWFGPAGRIQDLPRWTKNLEVECLPLCASLHDTENLAMAMVWVVETLNGPWYVGPRGFQFADYREAIHFKLRWF